MSGESLSPTFPFLHHVPRYTLGVNPILRRAGYGEGTEGGETEKEGGREMRKGMVIFLLLLGIPTLTHAQSAKDALMGLKKLQARTQAGISYNDYSNAVGEAKFPLNIFLESKDARNYTELSTSLQKIMAHYEYVGHLWNQKISTPGGWGTFIDVNSEKGKVIEQVYPGAKKILQRRRRYVG